jgi:RNA polymerase sigma factor (TIGR02999 family)
MQQGSGISENVAADRAGSGEALLPLVYEELRKLAAARMAGEWDTSTLQPTALVHEAWLRLASSGPQHWQNRSHFFAAAAEAMRRILIDRSRRKHAAKRGGGLAKTELEQIDLAVDTQDEVLLRVDEALQSLRSVDPDCAELIKLRFFAGLNYQEAADALGISERTAKRLWRFGRAWLYQELSHTPACN